MINAKRFCRCRCIQSILLTIQQLFQKRYAYEQHRNIHLRVFMNGVRMYMLRNEDICNAAFMFMFCTKIMNYCA